MKTFLDFVQGNIFPIPADDYLIQVLNTSVKLVTGLKMNLVDTRETLREF